MYKLILEAFGIALIVTPAMAINLNITSGNGVAGGSIQFSVGIYGIEGGGAAVNNAQLDILFDTAVFYVPADARRACQISPRLAQLAHTETLPSSPMAPAGMQRLRLSVIDTIQPLGDVTAGDFYFCSLDVREDAPAGPTQLAGVRQNVGDTTGRILPTAVGSAVVLIANPNAADALQPRGGGAGVAPGAAPAIDIPGAQPAAPQRQDQARGGSNVGDRPPAGAPLDRAGGAPSTPLIDRLSTKETPGAAVAEHDRVDPSSGSGAIPEPHDTPTVRASAASTVATVEPKTPTIESKESTRAALKTPTSKPQSTAKAATAPSKHEDSGSCSVSNQNSSFGGLSLAVVAWVVAVVRKRRGRS